MTSTEGTPPGAARDGARPLRVLVVDDEADSAESMAVLLRLYGHDVETAREGEGALAAASSFAPDVVLLDIGLPGMDGFEVAKRLNGLTWERKPFVVAVTGYATQEDRGHAAEAGFDVHLAKPADPKRLRELLERFREFVTR